MLAPSSAPHAWIFSASAHSSQSFHSSTEAVKAGCMLQSCAHLFSFLVRCLCSRFRHETSVQHCSFIRQLIRLLVAFSDKFSRRDMSFFSFFVRCALTCSTSTAIAIAAKRCNASQISIHKSASATFGLMHSLSPLHNPSIIPMLLTLVPKTFLTRQRKAASSALLIVRWTPSSASIIHARAPSLHRDPAAPLPNHMLTTCQRFPARSHPWQHGP